MASVHCDSCSNVFEFGPEKIKTGVVYIDGKKLDLVYFSCPYCCETNIIGAHDHRWYELRNDLERAKARYRKYSKIGDVDLVNNSFKTVLRKNKKLSDYTDLLIAKVRGKFKVNKDDTLVPVE